MDVHGAGAQRSDLKVGNPDDYPYGFGPQGDVIRIYNYVRLVRNSSSSDIRTINQNSLLQVYPNPATDFITINLDNNTLSNSFIYCYNTSGQLIFVEDNNNSEIDVSMLQKGVYFIKVSTDKNIYYTKFIKN